MIAEKTSYFLSFQDNNNLAHHVLESVSMMTIINIIKTTGQQARPVQHRQTCRSDRAVWSLARAVLLSGPLAMTLAIMGS